MKSDLLHLLKQHSFQKGDFILSSGAKSNYYIDCKPTLLLATGIKLVSDELLNEIEKFDDDIISLVAGVEAGGFPLATAICMDTYSINALYIRKSAKEHGSKKLIEGIYTKGQSVILLEDTLTTGRSCVRALEVLKDAGLNTVAVICVVDRLEGGSETIKAQFNIPTISLFTIKDFQ